MLHVLFLLKDIYTFTNSLQVISTHRGDLQHSKLKTAVSQREYNYRYHSKDKSLYTNPS